MLRLVGLATLTVTATAFWSDDAAAFGRRGGRGSNCVNTCPTVPVPVDCSARSQPFVPPCSCQPLPAGAAPRPLGYYPPDPNGCPPSVNEGNGQSLLRRVNAFADDVYLYNFSDYPLVFTLRYWRYENGVLAERYCVERRMEVPAQSNRLYGRVTHDPNARYLTAEYLQVWAVTRP